MPRHKLIVAVAELLTLRLLAGCRVDDQVEDLAALGADRRIACRDRAAVDIHVLFHRGIESRIAGKLDRGRRAAAEAAASAGGEGNHVRAAGYLTGCRDGVVTGGVHEDEARCADALGIT